MKRKSQKPLQAEEFNHFRPYSRPTIPFNLGRKTQLPTQEVITAATILYSFTNPQVFKRKRNVSAPPRIPLQEQQDIPFHHEQLKREIMHKAENKLVVSTSKKLTDTDVSNSQGRLMLPKSFVIDEVMPLLNENESLEDGINVKVYNNQLQKFDMVFRSWANGKVYILRSDWNKFHDDNDLKGGKEGTDVDVCVFRHAMTEKICFAVLRKDLGVAETEKGFKNRGKG